MATKPAIKILGIRGLPARHGGFETFAEKLALYLVEQGWQVEVYCQNESGNVAYEEEWQGIKLTHIPVRMRGASGSIEFDIKSSLRALKNPEALILTLGYNTAFLSVLYRLFGRSHLMNMDGLEWKRSKWSLPVKAWFYLNERFGCWFANHLIADHPAIKAHLATRVPENKITMIPYGGEQVGNTSPDILLSLGLQPSCYALVIARPEPENSILEIVRAFSKKKRNLTLIVLGAFRPQDNNYHRQVMEAASSEVRFPGAIYDRQVVNALRKFAAFYLHGHQVGGTNPSLIEALGAGSAVIAHDNQFNRWVAQEGGCYFTSVEHCSELIDGLLEDATRLDAHRHASIARFEQAFKWESILNDYERLFMQWHPVAPVDVDEVDTRYTAS